MSGNKNSLAIRLTEPVVYLKGVDFTGYRSNHSENSPPSMLRGLLTMNLVKPIRITSVEIELQARSSVVWPESFASPRIEVVEENRIYFAKTVYFSADLAPPSRRALSVDPGFRYQNEGRRGDHECVLGEADDENENNGSPSRLHATTHARHASADHSTFQREYVSHAESGHLHSYSPCTPASASPPISPRPSIANFHATASVAVQPTDPITPNSHCHWGEDSPGRALEDFRRALKSDLNTTSTRRSLSSNTQHVRQSQSSAGQASSSSSTQSHPDYHSGQVRDASCDRPDLRQLSKTSSASAPATSLADDNRGRHRFSFSAVSNALLKRVRSSSPLTTHFGEREVRSETGHGARGRSEEKGKMKETRSPLVRVSEVLGFDTEDNKEGDGWKEFKKGTYTYPISFAIPANSPPSTRLEHGSVIWRLTATAHRPGTFKTKLTTSREVTVVATPGEDDLEDTGPIIVERSWEEQMHYLLVISGRSFHIGGAIPLQMTFMPLTKVKIHRIVVLLEEHTVYRARKREVPKNTLAHRIVLVSIKHPDKSNRAILPLADDSVDAFRGSPMYPVLINDGSSESENNLQLSVSELVSSLMGPGPWVLQFDARIPASQAEVHPTNANKNSNMIVKHVLKIVVRVERGDDDLLDIHGNRKLFDIVVHTPIRILSSLCNSDYLSLPQYTESSVEGTSYDTLSCRCHNMKDKGDIHYRHATSSLPAESTSDCLAFLSTSSALANAETSTAATSLSTMRSFLHGDTTILAASTQYERLVTGLESEIGEAPPPYHATQTLT